MREIEHPFNQEPVHPSLITSEKPHKKKAKRIVDCDGHTTSFDPALKRLSLGDPRRMTADEPTAEGSSRKRHHKDWTHGAKVHRANVGSNEDRSRKSDATIGQPAATRTTSSKFKQAISPSPRTSVTHMQSSSDQSMLMPRPDGISPNSSFSVASEVSSGIKRTSTEYALSSQESEVERPSKKLRTLSNKAARHAKLLATKWMGTKELKELAEKEGLVYKQGKFSKLEEEQLDTALRQYQKGHWLSDEQLRDLIFVKKGRDTSFWSTLTVAVPQRPLSAIYAHVRRTHHPLAMQGKWTGDEDQLLIQAITDLGQQWERVSERVGRMAGDCRDRYRNHIVYRATKVFGAWKSHEEEELIRIVAEMQEGKDLDNDIFWTAVSQKMNGTRTRTQCRAKWQDCLSKQVKSEGENVRRWNQQDAFILVHKINSLDVSDDSEIDWKILPDGGWNLFSAHMLQRRWLTMKRGVKGSQNMSFREIMEILLARNAEFPGLKTKMHPTATSYDKSSSAPTRPKAKRRIVSAAHVDGELEDE